MRLQAKEVLLVSILSVLGQAAVTKPQAKDGVSSEGSLYKHVSCWSSRSGIAPLTGAAFSSKEMTAELCATSCHGSSFFALAAGSVCYCGDFLQASSSAHAKAGCTFPCAGDSTEQCGSAVAANLYALDGHSPSDLVAAVKPIVGGFKYASCYSDYIGRTRTLGAASYSSSAMSVDSCAAFCSEFKYFGVGNGRECYCGDSPFRANSAKPELECDYNCEGNPSQLCGGAARISLYQASPNVNVTAPVSTNSTTLPANTTAVASQGLTSVIPSSGPVLFPNATATASATASQGFSSAAVDTASVMFPNATAVVTSTAAPSQGFSSAAIDTASVMFPNATATVTSTATPSQGFSSVIDPDAALFPNVSTTGSSTVTASQGFSYVIVSTDTALFPNISTTATVTSAVSQGFPTVTASQDSVLFPNVSVTIDSSSASSTASVESIVTVISATIISSTGIPTLPSSTISSASASSTVPVLPAVSGYDFVSCWAEPAGARALTGASTASDDMTLESCAAFCADWPYFGVEYGRECYCGLKPASSSGSAEAPMSGCSFPCAGNAEQNCGGNSRLNVYRNPNQSGPQAPKTVGAYSYFGCATDAADRTLKGASMASNDMSLDKCEAFCGGRGFGFFGTEYSRECFCGNDLQGAGQLVDDGECNKICAGSGSQLCGQANRLTMYKRTTGGTI